jgi:hypothetical protein
MSSSSNTNNNNATSSRIYGQRAEPIRTQFGIIDGRSNAHAAFEQKCQLLRDYKKEFGHVHVGTRRHGAKDDKYYKLIDFIEKSRKMYRSNNAKGAGGDPATQRRIAILDEIGIDWGRKLGEEAEHIWQNQFQKLKVLYEKYGHCCVQAIMPFDENGDEEERNNKKELIRWAQTQNRYLKLAKEEEEEDLLLLNNINQQVAVTKEQREGADDAAATTTDAPDIVGRNHHTTVAREDGKEGDGTGGDGDDENTDDDGLHTLSDVIDSTTTTIRRRRRENTLPKYWTDAHQRQLKELKCNWLHSTADSFMGKNDYKPCTAWWYHRVEEFRNHIAKHGNGLVTIHREQVTKPFIAWTLEQRKFYKRVQQGKLKSNPVYERCFAFLKRLGFIFDESIIQQEKERLARVLSEAEAEEAAKQTPRAVLEMAETEARQAAKMVEDAKKRAAEARREINQAEALYKTLQGKVKEAQARVANDPVGKCVNVKPRGGGKQSGDARVTGYSRATILSEQLLTFYDVEYLEDGTKERHVDGLFVTWPGGRVPSAVVSKRKRAPPAQAAALSVAAAAARRPITRSRKC